MSTPNWNKCLIYVTQLHPIQCACKQRTGIWDENWPELSVRGVHLYGKHNGSLSVVNVVTWKTKYAEIILWSKGLFYGWINTTNTNLVYYIELRCVWVHFSCVHEELFLICFKRTVSTIIVFNSALCIISYHVRDIQAVQVLHCI